MTKFRIVCYEDHFQVFEFDSFGQETNVCNFWSYDSDIYDSFIKFLDYKDFGYEVVEEY